MTAKKSVIGFIFFFILSPLLFSQKTPPVDTSKSLHFNPWALILYRPYNNGDLNDVRCWLKLEDEEGNDVTYSAVRSAKYEWKNGEIPPNPNWPPDFSMVYTSDVATPVYDYRKTYYLSGGMAMHLNIKPGKYKISFYTPVDKTNMFECENKGQWESNVFEYDTENPAKVLYVLPTANDNGFYDGGWWIDYKTPQFYKHVHAKQKE